MKMTTRDRLMFLAVVVAVLATVVAAGYVRIKFLVDCADALGWVRCLFHM